MTASAYELPFAEPKVALVKGNNRPIADIQTTEFFGKLSPPDHLMKPVCRSV